MKQSIVNNFAKVPQAQIPRSSFLRPSTYKTTFSAHNLIPFFIDEALPGDTFNLKSHMFCRLATPLKPIMDQIYLETFYFAVPYRLVWNNFQKFMGEQVDPGDSTDYLIPQITLGSGETYITNSFQDYLGLPTYVDEYSHSALPLRAAYLIWNEWFRDQNIQDSLPVSKDDGPDSYNDYGMLHINKPFDYFTSCLPWPQKGDAVVIPLSATAPVIPSSTPYPEFRTDLDATSRQLQMTAANAAVYGGAAKGGATEASRWTASGLVTDTSDLGGTINALREAFQLQKLYERDARGGTRYTEIIKSHFGVTSPDARLQRPEYLGGGRTVVNMHPIAQTSATGATGTPQGNLSGMGTAAATNGFIKSFTEHTIILGFCAVRAQQTYQQGLDRMWSRRTRWDLFWPALSSIGEQAVLNKEIYCQGTAADSQVFGYQERWSEYRYKNSMVTGEFRSNSIYGSLDSWHLAEDYPALPVLNGPWIEDGTDYTLGRCLTLTGSDAQFLLDVYHDLNCVRPMPINSVPGNVDHF